MKSDVNSARNHLEHLVFLYEKNKIQFKGSLSRKLLFVLKNLFCILMALPDAITYHAYSAKNALTLSQPIHFHFLSLFVRYWCEFGAPIGVYFFALNNLYRWCAMINEAITMYPHYNKKTTRWSIFCSTTILAALSVVPFYGMSSSANILYVFVIGNSVARFCMDHYAWQKIISGFFEKKAKFKKMGLVTGTIFLTGVVTATYLYPFAKEASNAVFAIFGVAPTCLLWGLDAKASWGLGINKIVGLWNKDLDQEKVGLSYDKDIRITRGIVILILCLISLAGALSETMMAATNAHYLFYPRYFLAICAGIAFSGIYLTGPIQIAQHVFDFLQSRRGNKNASELRKYKHTLLEDYLRLKLKNRGTSKSIESPSDITYLKVDLDQSMPIVSKSITDSDLNPSSISV